MGQNNEKDDDNVDSNDDYDYDGGGEKLIKKGYLSIYKTHGEEEETASVAYHSTPPPRFPIDC